MSLQRKLFDFKSLDGKPCYYSPREGGRLDRSYITYLSGIPELSEYLESSQLKLGTLEGDFGMEVFDEVVVFNLYRNESPFWAFSILKKDFLEIRSIPNQKLSIKKDPKVSGDLLGMVALIGLPGAIVAGAIDALTTRNKDLKDTQIIEGTIFEIIVKTDDGIDEKILICCSSKKTEQVNNFLNTIQTPPKKGCYIATVCYEDIDAPEVIKFREYRDNKLNNHLPGRLFISIYYSLSPGISRFLYRHKRINKLTKKFILDKIYKWIS